MQRKLLCRRVLVVTKLSNIALNDFDAKESVRCKQLLVVTELVVSGTQCKGRKIFAHKCLRLRYGDVMTKPKQVKRKQTTKKLKHGIKGQIQPFVVMTN